MAAAAPSRSPWGAPPPQPSTSKAPLLISSWREDWAGGGGGGGAPRQDWERGREEKRDEWRGRGRDKVTEARRNEETEGGKKEMERWGRDEVMEGVGGRVEKGTEGYRGTEVQRTRRDWGRVRKGDGGAQEGWRDRSGRGER